MPTTECLPIIKLIISSCAFLVKSAHRNTYKSRCLASYRSTLTCVNLFRTDWQSGPAASSFLPTSDRNHSPCAACRSAPLDEASKGSALLPTSPLPPAPTPPAPACHQPQRPRLRVYWRSYWYVQLAGTEPTLLCLAR